jgi:muramoyltetrapeptide carboxypeptidase
MADLIRPPRLRAGATVGVAAISGPPNPARLEVGLERVRTLGFGIREASNLRAVHGLFAGSDAERAAGYRELLTDPEVRAILFARGGYGAARVLPHLDASEIAANPKPHLGGSDLTALYALFARIPATAFYGPMVAVEMTEPEELDWMRVLSGEVPGAHEFAPGDVLSPGRGAGPLVGGCLSLVASLCGTPEALDGSGKLFFWEDIGEESYRLDRMLTQLERSGTFERLQGMIIGSVVSRDRTEPADDTREYLRDRFRGARFPVACGFPAGHGRGPRTVPLHAPAVLDLEASPARLRFPEPAVI